LSYTIQDTGILYLRLDATLYFCSGRRRGLSPRVGPLDMGSLEDELDRFWGDV
jgi:hypothetical protein